MCWDVGVDVVGLWCGVFFYPIVFLPFRELIRLIMQGANFVSPSDQSCHLLIRLVVQVVVALVVERVSRSGAVWKDVVWPFDFLLEHAVESEFTCGEWCFKVRCLR